MTTPTPPSDAEKFNADNYSVQELLQLLNLPPRIQEVTENDIMLITTSNITKYNGKAISKRLIAPRESAQYMQLSLFYKEIQVKLITAVKAYNIENPDPGETRAARMRVEGVSGAIGQWDPAIARANSDASAAIRERSRIEAAEAAAQSVQQAWRSTEDEQQQEESEVYDRQQEEYAQFDKNSQSRLRIMSDPNEQLRWERNQYLPWEPDYTEDTIQITVTLLTGRSAAGQTLMFSNGTTAEVKEVVTATTTTTTTSDGTNTNTATLNVTTSGIINARSKFAGVEPECSGTVTKIGSSAARATATAPGETATATPSSSSTREREYRSSQAQLAATNRQNQFELAVDENGHYIMKQRQLSIPSAYNVPIAQGTMNPTLRNMYTRIVVINSKRRATLFPHTTDPLGASSSTNFNVQLSEELKNVVSLQMMSITMPYSWYAVDAATGTNCFHITATPIDPRNPTADNTASSVTTTITVATGNYTPLALIAEINSRLNATDESSLIKNNLEAAYVAATGKCQFENKSVRTVKFKLTFFDPKRVLDCGASCRQSNKINNCLGWILGFRSNSVYTSVLYNSFALDGMVYDIPNPFGINPLTSEAVIDTYGPKYFMLVLDDYKNNRINGGIVSVTNTETRLDQPYYYDSDIPCESIPDPFGGPTDKITVNIPSEPRTLTEAQLYAVNEIRRNRDLTRVDRVAEPTSSNVFAMVNFNKNGLAIGSTITDSGLALSAFTRDYFGPVTLQRLKVTLVDDNGFVVNLNGNDWSFTFAAKALYEY
jgi:hypothetical protein